MRNLRFWVPSVAQKCRLLKLSIEMGHFRVAVCLGFDVSLGAQLLYGK